MSTETPSPESTARLVGNVALNIAALVFFYFGMTRNLLFISAGLVCLALSMIGSPRQKKWGYATFGVAAVYFLFVLGYGIGKDMAVRDNATTAATPDYGVTIHVRADAPAPAVIAQKRCAHASRLAALT